MKQQEPPNLYTNPMIYDILYTPDTWREIDALEKVEKTLARRIGRDLERDRLWLEPACGSGRYLRTAAGRGRRTAGFDLDPGMLRYAENRQRTPSKPEPLLFQADMSDFLKAARDAGLKPGQVDFAFNPVNSIRHLDSDRAMLSHFEQMATLIRPGAVYVVGLSLTDYGFLLPEEDNWIAKRGRCLVNQLVNYLPPEPGTKLARVEQVISHLTIERPDGLEHHDHAYGLRTYDRGQWRSLVEKSALDWAGSFGAKGQPAPDIPLSYQLEALILPPGI